MIPLRAGPLEMVFDAPNAFLRHVRVGRREILRGIFAAVRDRNWGTVVPRVEGLDVTQGREDFSLRFRAICREGEIDFAWDGEVSGSPDGEVRFVFDGKAASSFWKNRIGLCVLHPIVECAGARCKVVRVDGTVLEGSFPRWISPHQPFGNIRSMRHEVAPGLDATVELEGEAFEMEDQRNWTDGSFKTYGTPLAEPYPVRLEAGSRIRHVARLSLAGTPPPEGKDVNPASLRIAWEKPVPRPPIGFGMATHGEDLEVGGLAALRELGLSHLRVDVEPARIGWEVRLREAARLGFELEIAVTLSGEGDGEIDRLLASARAQGAVVARWLVFLAGEKVTPAAWVVRFRSKLDALGDATPVGAGTNAYFAELNRGRPDPDAPAFPCYSVNPQVHAFDDHSLVESLEAQRATVQTARQFSPRPVVVSPITLRPRFNPNATEEKTPSSEPETDPRQSTVFAAAWTVGSLGRLFPCGNVHALTYFETHGPRGIMTASGAGYPVAQVFEALRGFAFACDAASSDPLKFQALALRKATGECRLLVAGFSDECQEITANVPSGGNPMAIALPPRGILTLDLP